MNLKRLAFFAVLTALFALWLTAEMTFGDPSRLRHDSDFPAFYNAGRIINNYPQGHLYDQDLQRKLYFELVPNSPESSVRYFAYTPFLAIVFAPFARLPYITALFCWLAFTVLMFVAGFRLAWQSSGLPAEHKAGAFLVCFSFLPFLAWNVLSPQTSVIAFFVLALTIYMDRQSRFILSGLALSVLLYKPPLLLLVVPMLLITKRWRTLIGFSAGAAILGILSLALIGMSGVQSYFDMLRMFADLKVSGGRPTYMEIDAYWLFFGLSHSKYLSTALLAVVCVIILPLLAWTWKRDRDLAWSTAITWTLILNFYVLIYDATLMIVAVLAWPLVLRHPRAKWLLIALFIAPWFQKLSVYGFQPMSIAIGAYGAHQFRVTLCSATCKALRHLFRRAERHKCQPYSPLQS